MWHREISDLARTVEKKRQFSSYKEEEGERTRELILEFLAEPRSIPEIVEFTCMDRESIYRHTMKLCNAKLAEKVQEGRNGLYQRRNHV